jgi:hypothetical protein
MIYIQVDLDNLWLYEQEFGIPIHDDREYIYSQSLPIFLSLLRKARSKATFMVVGQDLTLPACQRFCKKAIAEGHEIANHTWSHPISFAKLSNVEKKSEILKTHKKIIEVCGQKPLGFRGPGYYQDREIISILYDLGYRYDSSVLPGFAQLFMSTYSHIKGVQNSHKVFGNVKDIISKNRPYIIDGLDTKQKLVETPISVLPFIRMPIHTTFAYFFGEWYRKLILYYLRSRPSYVLYLFHAIDFVDLGNQDPNHPVIPLRYSFNQRIQFVQDILDLLVKVNRGGIETFRVNANFL